MTFGQQLKTHSYRLAEDSRERRLLFLSTQQLLKNKKCTSPVQKKRFSGQELFQETLVSEKSLGAYAGCEHTALILSSQQSKISLESARFLPKGRSISGAGAATPGPDLQHGN